MTDARLIESLRAALEASPDDATLRLHFAELLLEHGLRDDALRELGRVLSSEPTSARALELITQTRATQPEVDPADRVDWGDFERQLRDVVPPMFVDGGAEQPTAEAWEIERSAVTLADV